ncbi:MAG: GNAT family protein [Phycisphaerales bacterium]
MAEIDGSLLEPMRVEPTAMSNGVVRLEPLDIAHAVDLHAAIDDRAFEFMPMRSSVRTLPEVRRYIGFQSSRPDTIAFAVIDNTSGRAVGSTSFMSIRAEHRSLEIGSTWLAASARGTRINPAMKHLMLRHAFDTLVAVRVELRTDALNARSRRAIEKLGAVPEGVLRSHMIMPDGRLRDTVVYAITRAEWPTVRERLRSRFDA